MYNLHAANERNLGTFTSGSGEDGKVHRRLTGNYRRDCESGAFRCDESDPEYTEMLEDVIAWRVPNGETCLSMDAGESATITRQLLYIKARTYDIKYPMFKARDFIPESHEVPTGDEQWAYWTYDSFGMAKMIANAATDFPRVDVSVSETKQNIIPLGVSFAYTVQDLRRIAAIAARGQQRGASIDAKRASRARMAMEAAIDDLAAVGAPDVGFTGFVNNANVPLLIAPTGSWASASALQIIADMNAGPTQIMTTTNEVEIPDTMLFPVPLFQQITAQPFSTLGNVTIAMWFQANNPHIEDIDQWYKLNKANAAGNGGRIVTYRRDPDAVFMEIPQEFEQFAPQLKGMEYEVPCHARFGGVAIPYPLSMLYTDGCN